MMRVAKLLMEESYLAAEVKAVMLTGASCRRRRGSSGRRCTAIPAGVAAA